VGQGPTFFEAEPDVLSVQCAAEHSLFFRQNSLFFEIFSLLISVGNYSNNRCGTAVSAFEIVGLDRKSAIFPVKFPVCREFALETGANCTASPASHSINLG
jgi:hypothetical protein